MKIIKTLEVKILEHCNRKCIACGTFANIAEPENYNIEQFRNDLKRLSEIYDQIDTIRIYGGEPLLSKQLTQYIDITKDINPNSQVEIITNGILFKNMTKEFFDCVKKNEAKIVISKYPDIKEEAFGLERLKEKGVKYSVLNVNYFYVKFSHVEGDAYLNYCNCIVPISYYLHAGRLYHCPYELSIKHYDKKFNTNYSIDACGIDIYNFTAAEIDEALMNPSSFCKHCTIDNGFVKCEQSKPQKNNWDKTKTNEKLILNLQDYQYRTSLKEVTYMLIVIKDGEFNILRRKESELKNGEFILLLNDEGKSFYEKILSHSVEKWNFKLIKVISANQLSKLNKGEDHNLLYCTSQNKIISNAGKQERIILRELIKVRHVAI